MKLYQVIFTTGEYEDHEETSLVVFLHQHEAESYAQMLRDVYADWSSKDADGNSVRYSKEWRSSKPHQLLIDYNGPYFYVSDVDVEGELKALISTTHPELFI